MKCLSTITKAAASLTVKRRLQRLVLTHRPSTSTSTSHSNNTKWIHKSSFSTTQTSNVPPILSAVHVKDGGKAGHALVASHSIAKGVNILTETLTDPKFIMEYPNRWSLRKDDGVHLNMQSLIRYTNHSFDPNARILFPSSNSDSVATSRHHHHVVLESLKVVQSDEEITIDYNETETVMVEPFVDHESGKRVGYGDEK